MQVSLSLLVFSSVPLLTAALGHGSHHWLWYLKYEREDCKTLHVAWQCCQAHVDICCLERCSCSCHSCSLPSHNWPSLWSWLQCSLNTSLNLFSSLTAEKCSAFFVKLNQMNPRATSWEMSQRPGKVSGREPQDGFGSVTQTLDSWHASKYLCLLGQQNSKWEKWCLANRKTDFRYKGPDSAPASTSRHHPCLSLFVTQKFKFLWKLIWNFPPRRTRTAHYSTLGYQNLVQRMLQSACKWCLQPKANFTHCFKTSI